MNRLLPVLFCNSAHVQRGGKTVLLLFPATAAISHSKGIQAIAPIAACLLCYYSVDHISEPTTRNQRQIETLPLLMSRAFPLMPCENGSAVRMLLSVYATAGGPSATQPALFIFPNSSSFQSSLT